MNTGTLLPLGASLIPGWNALSTDEQMVVLLKALVGVATNKGEFFEIIRTSGYPAPNGKSWSTPILNIILASLQKKALLGEDLALSPGLAEALAVRAATAPGGHDLIAKIMAAVPRSSREIGGSSWGYNHLPVDADASLARRLRLAVLANDADEVERLCTIVEAEIGGADAPGPLTVWLGRRLPDPTWIEALDERIQDRLVAAHMAAAIDHGWIEDATIGLIDHARQHDWGARQPRIDLALLRLDVLGERFEPAKARMARRSADAWPVLSAKAGIAFLSGNTDEALPLFRLALKQYRKIRSKRNVILPGEAGVFHLLALLKADDARLHGEIETLLKVVGRRDSTRESAYEAYSGLELLFHLATGDTERCRWEADSLRQFWRWGNPLGLAVATLALAIADNPAAVTARESNDGQLFDQVAGVMPVVGRLMAEVHMRVSGGDQRWTSRLAMLGHGPGLRAFDIVPVKPGWERIFDKLTAFLAGDQKKTPGTQPDKRLAFLLNHATCEVTALEQAAKGNGWSGGRPVSLKRLRELDPKLGYLTSADRQVAKTILRTDEFYHPRPTYEFDNHRTLLALIGHPHVFDADRPDRHIDLVAHPAELVVTEQAKGGIRITLSHRAVRPRVYIEKETPSRWRVIEISAKLVELAATLEGGLVVPAEARERVVAMIRSEAPLLPIRSELADAETAAVAGDAMAVLQISAAGEGLHLKAVVRPLGNSGPAYSPGEGGGAPLIEVDGAFVRVKRDLAAEQEAVEAFVVACPAAAPWRTEDHAWHIDSLEDALEVLQEITAIADRIRTEWPEGQVLKPTSSVGLSALSFKVASAKDWFEVGGTITADEDLVLDMAEILDRLGQARGRFVPLDNGRFLALTEDLKRRLDQIAGITEATRGGRRLSAAGAVAATDLMADAGEIEAPPAWRDLVAAAREAGTYEPKIPAGLQADLRDYQHDGFVWMMRLARLGLGACLADDMGLGKTVQAIAVLLARAEKGPALVVAPTSVCHNWEVELARFAPSLAVIRLSDAGDRTGAVERLGPGDVLIVSYTLLAIEVETLEAGQWGTMVFDEAQNLKNAGAQRSQASRRLSGGFRIALSGTPVENRLDELWSLLDTIVPGLLGSRESFQRRFAGPIERDRNPQARAALRMLIRPYLLRRTKAAVLAELPPRTEIVIAAPPGPEERAFTEALRRKALAALEEPDASPGQRRIRILAEIMKLRRAACHPTLIDPDCGLESAKLAAFLELVDELRENGHRALVFSQFVGHLEIAKAALAGRQVAFLSLDGSTPASTRAKLVAAFQAGEGDLFLISLRAGGTGINLTAADYVIHLDPWWNPAVEDQATDRAHRIGQTRPVTVYRLVTEDSIEERILSLHATKRDLAADLLDETANTRLSENDLLDLIAGAGG